MVIGVGGRIVSVDIFAGPELFRALYPKILKASALSALTSPDAASLSQEQAAAFLRSLRGRTLERKEGLGLGAELYWTGADLCLSALAVKDRVVHLAAFPQEGAAFGSKPWDGQERRLPVADSRSLLRE